MGLLGGLLRIGFPSAEQRARGIVLLRKAAAAGDLQGQYTLGVTLANREHHGHPTNLEGIALLEKAAARKFYSAFGNLGQLFHGYWIENRDTSPEMQPHRREMATESLKWLVLEWRLHRWLIDGLAVQLLDKAGDRDEMWLIARHRARKWLDQNGHSHIDLPKKPPWRTLN